MKFHRISTKALAILCVLAGENSFGVEDWNTKEGILGQYNLFKKASRRLIPQCPEGSGHVNPFFVFIDHNRPKLGPNWIKRIFCGEVVPYGTEKATAADRAMVGKVLYETFIKAGISITGATFTNNGKVDPTLSQGFDALIKPLKRIKRSEKESVDVGCAFPGKDLKFNLVDIQDVDAKVRLQMLTANPFSLGQRNILYYGFGAYLNSNKGWEKAFNEEITATNPKSTPPDEDTYYPIPKKQYDKELGKYRYRVHDEIFGEDSKIREARDSLERLSSQQSSNISYISGDHPYYPYTLSFNTTDKLNFESVKLMLKSVPIKALNFYFYSRTSLFESYGQFKDKPICEALKALTGNPTFGMLVDPPEFRMYLYDLTDSIIGALFQLLAVKPSPSKVIVHYRSDSRTIKDHSKFQELIPGKELKIKEWDGNTPWQQ